MTDQDIVKRIQQGEKELFEALAQRYYQEIYRFCYYRVGEVDGAYDCTQETFLHLIRFLDAYVDRKHFRAWLYGIARNVCNDYFRSRKFITVDESYLDGTCITEGEFHQVEVKDGVIKALNQLPEIQRDVIILRFYGELKIREIAKITGVGIPTVKSRLKQGMDKLRRILELEGGNGYEG